MKHTLENLSCSYAMHSTNREVKMVHSSWMTMRERERAGEGMRGITI